MLGSGQWEKQEILIPRGEEELQGKAFRRMLPLQVYFFISAETHYCQAPVRATVFGVWPVKRIGHTWARLSAGLQYHLNSGGGVQGSNSAGARGFRTQVLSRNLHHSFPQQAISVLGPDLTLTARISDINCPKAPSLGNGCTARIRTIATPASQPLFSPTRRSLHSRLERPPVQDMDE